mgnify:CR=1 FL=1
MKVTHVDFISVVSFGGSLKSASSKGVVGDRPGQLPMRITADEDMKFIKLEKHINGNLRTKYVPMTNVSGLEVEDEAKAAVAKK